LFDGCKEAVEVEIKALNLCRAADVSRARREKVPNRTTREHKSQASGGTARRSRAKIEPYASYAVLIIAGGKAACAGASWREIKELYDLTTPYLTSNSPAALQHRADAAIVCRAAREGQPQARRTEMGTHFAFSESPRRPRAPVSGRRRFELQRFCHGTYDPERQIRLANFTLTASLMRARLFRRCLCQQEPNGPAAPPWKCSSRRQHQFLA
jgi:hypothetical protein